MNWHALEVLKFGAVNVLLMLRLLPRRLTDLVIRPKAPQLPTLLVDPTIVQSPV